METNKYQKKVSIIVPTHNRQVQVLSCLSSLKQISYQNVEIIVVDNNSTDNTVNSIREKYPDVKIASLPTNEGAVGGRNEGMRHSSGDYFCFVDSDNIVEKNFVDELVKTADSDESIGFIGPKMYYYEDPKRIWCAGVKINLLTSHTTYIGINQIDRGEYNELRETDQIPNVWMVKREVVEKIGLMDTVYVMSYGESDWPMRAQRAGYRSIICPQSIVYHDIKVPENISSNILFRGNPYRIYYFARNRAIFMKKFSNRIQYLFYLLFFNNAFLLMYLWIFIRSKNYSLINVYLKGFIDGLIVAAKAPRVITGTETGGRL